MKAQHHNQNNHGAHKEAVPSKHRSEISMLEIFRQEQESSSTVATALSELDLDDESDKEQQEFPVQPPRESFLLRRRRQRRNSFLVKSMNSTDSDQIEEKKCFDCNKEKEVRFATKNNEIVCITRFYDKYDLELHDKLWWSAEELQQRDEADTELVSEIEADYRVVLMAAFRSTRRMSHKANGEAVAGLSFEAMVQFSVARGLEACCCSDLRDDMIIKHSKRILQVQRTMPLSKKKNRIRWTDTRCKLMRSQSLKFSKASQLVAYKLAEFDAIFVLM